MLLVGLKAMVLGIALAGLVWLVDEIGDMREMKVRAEYAAKISAADKRAADADRRWREHYDAQFAARVAVQTETSNAVKALGAGCDGIEALRLKLNAIHAGRKR